jgi:hypothetical protein
VPTFRVLAWRTIPTQVEVTGDDGVVAKRQMPRWFMQEISRITMREGLAGTDDYLAEFAWSEPAACEGTVDEVLDTLVAERAAQLGRKPDGHPIEGAERYAGDGG